MSKEINKFLDYLKISVATTTCLRKSSQIKKFLRYLDEKLLFYRSVTKQNIEQYLLSLDNTTVSRQQYLSVIHEFYDFIEIKPNPADDILILPNRALKLKKVPSSEEIDRLIRDITSNGTEKAMRDGLMYELAYGSGLRRNEMVRLNIEDINFETKTIHVLGKGNKARKVPITEKALQLCREYCCKRQEFSGPLFVAMGSKRRISKCAMGLQFILRDSFRAHQLRHACATHMLKNGCSIRVIQEILGHNSLTSTQIYTNLNKEELRDVIEKRHPRKKGVIVTKPEF